MAPIRRLAGALLITAYAVVLVVPCGSAARPLSETRVTIYCECPSHLAHGNAGSVPLELARPARECEGILRAPYWTRLAVAESAIPAEPVLELAPPVPRA